MRSAFVLRLDSAPKPSEREFSGRIEEVDTGRELHFDSTEKMLTFLESCFEDAQRREQCKDDR
jgi:hypothetical protein